MPHHTTPHQTTYVVYNILNDFSFFFISYFNYISGKGSSKWSLLSDFIFHICMLATIGIKTRFKWLTLKWILCKTNQIKLASNNHWPSQSFCIQNRIYFGEVDFSEFPLIPFCGRNTKAVEHCFFYFHFYCVNFVTIYRSNTHIIQHLLYQCVLNWTNLSDGITLLNFQISNFQWSGYTVWLDW